MAWNPNIPNPTNKVLEDLQRIRENFQYLDANSGPYSSGVSGFTPTSVKAALDALAGVRIVEMGSNSNGTYVRWENGLQVCRHSINAGDPTVFGSGTLSDIFRSDSHVWTFPADFAAPPDVQAHGFRDTTSGGHALVGAIYRRVTTTQVETIQAWSGADDSTPVTIALFAIGVWK